ncbi:MAG: T9SS type A sorting domain-containing protein [Bacteroidia bacterium]|nr:T9SS type A sorting domain-containing protein [Bacteroidia bacterium]
MLERELRGNTAVQEISLPNLAAGIYWIKLQGANAVVTQKLIVK